MDAVLNVAGLGIVALSAAAWIYLMFFHGRFWMGDQLLQVAGGSVPPPDPESLPSVVAVVPARDEADVIAGAVLSLLMQDYGRPVRVVLVDDNSTDGTGRIAASVAQNAEAGDRLTVLTGGERPAGWTGKLWAVKQGVDRALEMAPDAAYLLLTDADIVHHAANLRGLVTKAEREKRDLVSLMVKLHCRSAWERLLVPAFVYFFQKLFPFPRVNNPSDPMAAAAGGCMLVRREALQAVGGIEAIRGALIDDCALARAIKTHALERRGADPSPKVADTAVPPGGIWLGLTRQTVSIRPYEGLRGIWDMVARSAYDQLHYSPLLLAGTVVGMLLIYLAPPVGALVGAIRLDLWMAGLGALGWGMMNATYAPTMRLYGMNAIGGLLLPLAAILYTLMTLDSARRHYLGRGGEWKGRVAGGTEGGH